MADDEQVMLEGMPKEKQALITTLLWSAKESALKALHWGLRLDTKCLQVHFPDTEAAQTDETWRGTYPIQFPNSQGLEEETSADIWHPIEVKLRGLPSFIGWWRNPDQFVRTVLIRHSSSLPSI